MKNILLFIMFFMITYSATAERFTVEIDGLSFSTLSDSTARVNKSSQMGENKDIVIPSEVTINENNYIITEIGDFSKTDIVSVEIPSSVTKINYKAFHQCSELINVFFSANSQLSGIGERAFSQCTSLTSVNFSELAKLKTIGSYAFYECTSLVSVNFSELMQKISNNAFSGCTSLTSVNFSGLTQLTTIESAAFSGCTSLTSVNFSGLTQLTTIESSAFARCTSLTSVNFGEESQLISLGGYAFNRCESITSIEIPSSVSSVGNYAFSGCSNLTSLNFGEESQLISLGNYAFEGCTSLTNIEIPGSVSSLGEYLFSGCSNLRSVNFGENSQIVSLGEKVFSGCKSYITNINFGDNSQLTTIGESLFKGFSNLERVNFGNNSQLASVEKYAFDNCYRLIEVNFGEESQLTTIKDFAFSGCTSLSSVNFGENSQLASIGKYAFNKCTGLITIDIPDNVTSIGEYAFYDCTSLANVYFSDYSQLISIGQDAFKKCTSLTYFEIPSGLTSFRSVFSSCANLSTVVLRHQNYMGIDHAYFHDNLRYSGVLYVPYSKLEQYINSSWKDYFYEIREFPQINDRFDVEIPTDNDVVEVNVRVVNENPLEVELVSLCSPIEGETLIIPSTVEGYDGTSFRVCAIKDSMLEGCDNLTYVSIPKTVNRIENAFLGCSNIETLSVDNRFPRDIEVTNETFSGLSDLVTLIVPSGTVERYAELEEWSKFYQIVEKSPVSIDDIHANSNSDAMLTLNLNTDELIAGMQYRITLPNGIMPLYENGSFFIELTERTENMTIVGHKDPDLENSYMFVMLSLEGDNITGTEGALLKIKLKLDEDIEVGNYEVILDMISATSSLLETQELMDTYAIITVDDTYIQERELSKGWTWYSTYVNVSGSEGLNMMKEDLAESAIQIKGQNNFVNNQNGIWYGQLNGLSSDQMYMIHMSEAATLEMTGELIDPSECPITLSTNWKWISYPLNYSMNLVTALSNYTPSNGDYIKSQNNGFAQYYSSLGWRGTLNSLTPGQGYMYQNTSGSVRTLVFADNSTKEMTKENVTTENNRWTPNESKYPTNMTMIAVVELDSDFEVAAFSDGECRGSARPVYIEELGKNIVFMTIYGEGDETINFRYYDINDDEEYVITNTMIFGANSTVGDLMEPYVLKLATVNIDEYSENVINIYPNPADRNAEIHFAVECEKIEVYNSLGVKISEYENVNHIDGIETSGVYMIKVIMNGDVKYDRIVVR